MFQTEPNTAPYRNKDGGNILFGPAALIPFTKAATRAKKDKLCKFQDVFKKFPSELLNLNQKIWKNVLWNSEKKTMIMNNQTLTEYILLYFWDRDVLTSKEIIKMYDDLRILNQLANKEDVEEIIESVVQTNE